MIWSLRRFPVSSVCWVCVTKCNNSGPVTDITAHHNSFNLAVSERMQSANMPSHESSSVQSCTLCCFDFKVWLHADMWVIEIWYWLVNRESCRVSQQKLDTVGQERGYKIFWQQILGELRFFFLWRLHYIYDRRSFKSCHMWGRWSTW